MKKIIKSSFENIFLLYKNFFNWLWIKISSIILTSLTWIIFVLPLFLIWLFYGWYFKIDMESFFNWTISNDTFLNVIMFLIPIVFGIFYYFHNLILLEYNLNLIEKKKNFNIWKIFFSKKNLKIFNNYIIVIALFSIILLIIISLFIFIFSWLIQYFWINEIEKIASSNIFSTPGIIFLIFLIWSFYLFFRLSFSFAFLVDENISALKAIKKSLKQTSWIKIFFKIISVLAIFWVFLLPLKVFENYQNIKVTRIEKYAILANKYNKLTEQEKPIFEALKLKFSWIDSKTLENDYKNLKISLFLISIIYFVFFSWIIHMVYINIYNNLIKK